MKKTLFFALMACAILFGCKKSEKTDPDTPTPGPDDPVKVDTAYAEVYLTIYASPFLYEYSDLKFYLCDENGDTVRQLASAVRSTPMDTLGADSAFYKIYKGQMAVYANYPLSLDSIKIFQTTEKVTVNDIDYTTCRVYAFRNGKAFDLERDFKYNNIMFVKNLTPVDKTLDSYYNFLYSCNGLYSYGIKLGTSQTTAESNYAQIINQILNKLGKWSIKYNKTN